MSFMIECINPGMRVRKVVVWTECYMPFTMGGPVLRPIGARIPCSYPFRIDVDPFQDLMFTAVISPKGKVKIVELVTGGIVADTVKELQDDLVAADPGVVRDQLREAQDKIRKLGIKMLSEDEFWSKFRE